MKPEDYGIRKYTWNDGLLDCHQSVNLYRLSLKELPFNFGTIDGHFSCGQNNLSSFKNFPKVIKNGLYCDSNQFESLDGCPQEIHGNIIFSHNLLTSLNGCPKNISGDFFINNNLLTSLDGGPDSVGRDFDCSHNPITTLNGMTKKIRGEFICLNTPIESLDFLTEDIGGSISIDCPFFESYSLQDQLNIIKKYRNLYKKVNCVENKDKKTTIKNLKKKIFISNLVLGVK